MSVLELPAGYREIYRIDLKQNKKQALIVNLLGIVVMAAMFMAAFAARGSISISIGGSLALQALVVFGCIIGYIVLHELTHGLFIRLFSGQRPDYGFSFVYAYAGSKKAYFKKWPYLMIALAPVVIWGLVFLVLQFLAPDGWWWVVYALQIMNLSGAAGDVYVTVLLLRMPRDLLVKDTGVAMTVYSAE